MRCSENSPTVPRACSNGSPCPGTRHFRNRGIDMQEALRLRLPDAEPVDRADFVEQARVTRRDSDASLRGLALTIRDVKKSFGDHSVLRGIDLHIPAGQ